MIQQIYNLFCLRMFACVAVCTAGLAYVSKYSKAVLHNVAYGRVKALLLQYNASLHSRVWQTGCLYVNIVVQCQTANLSVKQDCFYNFKGPFLVCKCVACYNTVVAKLQRYPSIKHCTWTVS